MDPNGMIWTDEQMLKALSTTDMGAGGLLPREVQDAIIKESLNYTSLLGSGKVRRRSVRQRSGQLDRMWLHQHITRKAADVFAVGAVAQGEGGGVGDVSAEQAALYDEQHEKFGSINWDTEKMVVAAGWTTESLRENLENGTLAAALRDRILKRMGTDMADLALNGDTALAGADRRSRLLKANDGWDKLSDGGNIVDAAGGFVSRSLFADLIKRMPRWLLTDSPNLSWVFNTDIRLDWLDNLAGRPGAEGAAAIGGQMILPGGFPVIVEPLIPSNKALAIAEASPAIVEGNIAGPFTFTTAANTFHLAVDAADQADNAAVAAGLLISIDFRRDVQGGAIVRAAASFTLTTDRVCKIINDALVRNEGGAARPTLVNVARPDPVHDRLILVSPTTGVASSLEVQDGAANNALALLGVGADNTRTTGSADAAAGGTQILEGTNIYLMDPANFAWIVITSDPGSDSLGVRVFTKFNPDRDRFEFILYYNSDALVENTQAMVKAIKVRTKQLTAI